MKKLLIILFVLVSVVGYSQTLTTQINDSIRTRVVRPERLANTLQSIVDSLRTSGSVTSIVGITGTKAEFNTAVTDGDFMYQSDSTGFWRTSGTTNLITSSIIKVDNDSTVALLTDDESKGFFIQDGIVGMFNSANSDQITIQDDGMFISLNANIGDDESVITGGSGGNSRWTNFNTLLSPITDTLVSVTQMMDSIANAIDTLGVLNNVLEDTSPQLGGNLDLNSNNVGDADAADLTKLSELTASSTELNYVDGVTSAIQTQLNDLIARIVTTATTGTAIEFVQSYVYNTVASPASGNITDDLTGAKLGLIQKIYHDNGTEPTYPAGWVNVGGTYSTTLLNIIFCEWVSGTRVEYWITQGE